MLCEDDARAQDGARPVIHQRLRERLRQDDLGATLVRGAFGGALVQGVHLAARVLTAVVLARVLGVNGFGIYALVMAILRVAQTPVSAGIMNVGLRYTAAYAAHTQWGLMHGLWRRLVQWTLAYGFAAAGVLLGAIYALNYLRHDDPLVLTLIAATPLLVLMPLANCYGGLIRGLHHTSLGQLPEFVIRPLGFLFLVLLTTWWLAPVRPGPELAVLLHVGAAMGAAGISIYWLRSVRPVNVRQATVAYESRTWLKAAVPLSLTGGMMIINTETDILMLGALAGPDEVGVYRVAAQGAQLVVFFEVALNLVMAPHISRLFAQGQQAQLQRMITWGTRIIFIGALCIALTYWLAGREILGWVFGAEYATAYAALAILSLGQVIKASCGQVGTILNMTNFERDTALAAGIAAILNIALNALLIPYFGTRGAASATALSLLTWNAILVVRVYQRTGLVSAIWRKQAA